MECYYFLVKNGILGYYLNDGKFMNRNVCQFLVYDPFYFIVTLCVDTYTVVVILMEGNVPEKESFQYYYFRTIKFSNNNDGHVMRLKE